LNVLNKIKIKILFQKKMESNSGSNNDYTNSNISYKIDLNYDNHSENQMSQNTTAQSEIPILHKLLPNNNENNLNMEEYTDYSFQSFIKKYQDAKTLDSTSWNRERQNYLREQNNKKKIILQEINQFDYNVIYFFNNQVFYIDNFFNKI
jgi:hypothetical protein